MCSSDLVASNQDDQSRFSAIDMLPRITRETRYDLAQTFYFKNQGVGHLDFKTNKENQDGLTIADAFRDYDNFFTLFHHID